MSLSLVRSRALLGLQAARVTVEVHLANGLPSFTLVGLADVEVKEARERVRSALQNAGLEFPHNKRITVNLAPADLPKVARNNLVLKRTISLEVPRPDNSFCTGKTLRRRHVLLKRSNDAGFRGIAASPVCALELSDQSRARAPALARTPIEYLRGIARQHSAYFS